MTMPYERTRALRWAGEFLRKVSVAADCSETFRREAVMILRHYPEANDIAHQAKHGWSRLNNTPWLEPEDKYEK